MRFLAIDEKRNIIHSSASAKSLDNFISSDGDKFQINGQPAIGQLVAFALSTPRGKRNAKK